MASEYHDISTSPWVEDVRSAIRKLRLQSPYSSTIDHTISNFAMATADQALNLTRNQALGQVPSHNQPPSPPRRIILSQAIVHPVLSNIVTEQAAAIRDVNADHTLISFSAEDILKKYTLDEEKLGSSEIVQAAGGGPADLCWILSKDDIENILVAQRRVIIRLNGVLKRLHPTVPNGRGEGDGWWERGSKAVKGLGLRVKQRSTDHTADDGETEDLWLEVGKCLSVNELELSEPQGSNILGAAELGVREDDDKLTADSGDSSAFREDEKDGDDDDGPDLKTEGQKRIWELPVQNIKLRDEESTDPNKSESRAEVASTNRS